MATSDSQYMSSNVTGSVYINGNCSYSGADIKIVINSYPDDSASNSKVSDLRNQLAALEKSLEQAQKDVSLYQKNVAVGRWGDPVKQGTDQLIYAQRGLTRANDEVSSIRSQIEAINSQLSSLQNSGQTQTASYKVLAECQTLSVSLFRDKRAVRSCGSVAPKGFVRGPREIAGSLIFTVFDQNVLYEFLDAHSSDFDPEGWGSALLDQLPPVDIIVSFANEYGNTSRMTIYGAEFMTEGQTMSIEDLLTENPVNYVARDIDPMRRVGMPSKKNSGTRALVQDFGLQKASDLLDEDDYKDFQKDSPYDRFLQRRNPFA
jgi:hypothetical protein